MTAGWEERAELDPHEWEKQLRESMGGIVFVGVVMTPTTRYSFGFTYFTFEFARAVFMNMLAVTREDGNWAGVYAEFARGCGFFPTRPEVVYSRNGGPWRNWAAFFGSVSCQSLCYTSRLSPEQIASLSGQEHQTSAMVEQGPQIHSAVYINVRYNNLTPFHIFLRVAHCFLNISLVRKCYSVNGVKGTESGVSSIKDYVCDKVPLNVILFRNRVTLYARVSVIVSFRFLRDSPVTYSLVYDNTRCSRMEIESS